jgi:hypothetical protein
VVLEWWTLVAVEFVVVVVERENFLAVQVARHQPEASPLVVEGGFALEALQYLQHFACIQCTTFGFER